MFLGNYAGAECAIKQANFSIGADALDSFKREAVLLLSLKPHPAIVQVLGISVDKNENIYVIMEFCENGSLDKYMHKHPLSEADKLHILQTCATGLAHLHHEHIVHRDIAARNILVAPPLKAKVAEYPLEMILLSHSLFVLQ